MAMTEVECWGLVEATRTAAKGKVLRQVVLVRRELKKRPLEDIVAFSRWFRTKMQEANRTDVLTAAEWIYAANGLPHVSGDGWEYFRAGLVACGRDRFEATLADADAMADFFTTVDEFEGEEMEYAASAAYEAASDGEDAPDEMYEPSVIDSFPGDVGSDARDPERFMSRFPKLTARFGRQEFWDGKS